MVQRRIRGVGLSRKAIMNSVKVKPLLFIKLSTSEYIPLALVRGGLSPSSSKTIPYNVVHRETAHHRETAQTRSNRFSGIAQLFLGRMGSDFGEILYMCVGRQGPMRVATEIISGKYMVRPRRLWKEVYL